MSKQATELVSPDYNGRNLFFVKKGFGSTYISGLKEGLSTRSKIDKVKFKSKNTKNYFKIEYRLIINTLKFLKK